MTERQQLALQLTAASDDRRVMQIVAEALRECCLVVQRPYLWGQGPQQLASQVAQGSEAPLQLLCWQTPMRQPLQMLWWSAEESCEQPLALHAADSVTGMRLLEGSAGEGRFPVAGSRPDLRSG